MKSEKTQNYEPVRVCHIVGKMNGGGVESFLMEYYRHINKDSVQFDFVIDSDSILIPLEEIEALGGRIIVIPPYQKIVQHWQALVALFNRENYLIVHSHLNTLSLISLSAAYHCKVPVRIAHSHATAAKEEKARTALKLALRPFANLFPTDRAACSKHAGEWLFGTKRQFTIINNATNLSELTFNSRKRSQAREDLGIHDDTFVIGHMGRLVETKNQSFLLECFREILKMRPNALLVLAGEGPMRSEYEKYVNANGMQGKVKFFGYVDDRNSFYSMIDVFAFPSLYEGFGKALLEAQQHQLPCVCSDRISEEALLSCNVTQLSLSDPPATWAKAIMKPAPQRVDGENGLSEAELNKFDINQAALKLERYYRELCEGIDNEQRS